MKRLARRVEFSVLTLARRLIAMLRIAILYYYGFQCQTTVGSRFFGSLAFSMLWSSPEQLTARCQLLMCLG